MPFIVKSKIDNVQIYNPQIIIEKLKPFFAGKNFVIAGGIFAGGDGCDVDIFPYGQSISSVAREIEDFADWFAIYPSVAINCVVANLNYGSEYGEISTQIITAIADTPMDVINSFDFAACQCAYDFKSGAKISTPEFRAQNLLKTIRLNFADVRYNMTLSRLAKYNVRKGYDIEFMDIDAPEKPPRFFNIDKLYKWILNSDGELRNVIVTQKFRVHNFKPGILTELQFSGYKNPRFANIHYGPPLQDIKKTQYEYSFTF